MTSSDDMRLNGASGMGGDAMPGGDGGDAMSAAGGDAMGPGGGASARDAEETPRISPVRRSAFGW